MIGKSHFWTGTGLLHTVSADITSMSIASANRITDMMQPLMIPATSIGHSDVVVLAGALILKL